MFKVWTCLHISNLLKVIVQSWWAGIVGKKTLPLVEHIAWINLAFALHLHSCLNHLSYQRWKCSPFSSGHTISLRFILNDKVDNLEKWEDKSLLLPRILLQTWSNCWGKNRDGAEVPVLRESSIYTMAEGSTVTISTWNTWRHKDPYLPCFLTVELYSAWLHFQQNTSVVPG